MCEKEKLFLELIEGFKWKYDENNFTDYLFGFKNGKYLFEIYSNDNFDKKKFIVCHRIKLNQELEDVCVDIHHNEIWKVFEKTFDMDENGMVYYMHLIIKKYLKLNNVVIGHSTQGWIDGVEENFKIK